MKTSIQKGETQRLHIEAEWDEIADDYKDVVSAYLQLPIPGFRQGHAPKDMVERHFAHQIRQDFAKQCGERLCRRALLEQNVTPAGPLEITTYHVEAGVQFVFQAEFEASPEIQLPDLETIPLQGETEAERRDEITAWLLATTGVSVSRRLVEWELTFDEQPQAAAGSAAWEAAANRVKLMLILQKIAATEGIEIDERDLDERIAKIARELYVTEKSLRDDLRQKRGLARLSAMLLAERTLDYLLEIAWRQKET